MISNLTRWFLWQLSIQIRKRSNCIINAKPSVCSFKVCWFIFFEYTSVLQQLKPHLRSKNFLLQDYFFIFTIFVLQPILKLLAVISKLTLEFILMLLFISYSIYWCAIPSAKNIIKTKSCIESIIQNNKTRGQHP